MTGPGRVEFRAAREDDLHALVLLLADDEVAAGRGGYASAPTPAVVEAFTAIQRDPNNHLLVGEQGGEVVAMLQLTLIPGLSRGGMRRALIEAVRVKRQLRGLGIGSALMQAAILQARREGCGLVQLTSDKQRGKAHALYERLGFVASHEGMKLML